MHHQIKKLKLFYREAFLAPPPSSSPPCKIDTEENNLESQFVGDTDCILEQLRESP